MTAYLRTSILFFLLITFFQSNAQTVEDSFTSPSDFFGFQPGGDRMLFNYDQLINYLEQLDKESDRIKMIELGESSMGKKMYLTFLSSEENIRKLDELKHINKDLAINPNLSEENIEQYVSEGKVFVLATLSMHSTEVGPSQSAPLVAYEIARTSDDNLLEYLSNVVYMFVPCHNPDGMDMIVDYYNKTKDSKYEGSSLPKVYHKYVGHNINRDFVSLTQAENRLIADIYNNSWYPQVMVEKHQMGWSGPRYFVPPMHDPIAENIDEELWNWTWIFGSNIAKDMTSAGLAGVSQHYLFDDYWPGSTETALWKNIISLLTECASVQIAKPIYIEKNELKAYGKGLGEYKKSINMPKPWAGGWWRLSDIVDYELSSTWALIKTASIHKEDILMARNELCRKEVAKGKTLAPAYFILPHMQHDQSELLALIHLLDEHGVSVYKINRKIEYKGKLIKKGDFIVPLAQPYRAFIKEVMEKQKFPERHYTPNGEMIKPYDITSWSLPLHRGVSSWYIDETVNDIEVSLEALILPMLPDLEEIKSAKSVLLRTNNNESYKIAFRAIENGIKVVRAKDSMTVNKHKIFKGDFILPYSAKLNKLLEGVRIAPVAIDEKITINVEALIMPSIALIETSFHDMDAGWTRFLFDTYHVAYSVLKPGEVCSRELTDFDVIIFPDNNKSILLEGKYKGRDGAYSIPSIDPQYSKGIGKKGLQKLMKYVDEGGSIISWGASSELFLGPQSIEKADSTKEEFQLPVNDISAKIGKKGFEVAGSLLNIDLKKDHPLTLGMQKTAKVFSRGRPVFETRVPAFDMKRRVIASYAGENVLASGYIKNGELIHDKVSMVWIKKGKGDFVLYAFNPQFRGSTQGTFKLLFNALLL